jgi:ABC-type nitrate/sulfonate/bicarbonate transport system substrate-binding protein
MTPMLSVLPLALVLLVVLALGGFAAPGPSAAAAVGPEESTPAAAALAGAQQLTLVRFGSPQAVSDAGVFIARAWGYFRELGLDVETVYFQSAPDTIPALAAGELEVAGGTFSIALLNAAERGVGLKIVADKGTSRPGFEFSQLAVRRDLLESGEVRELADLRGRRLAVASTRSGAEALLAHILVRGGVSIDEVDLAVLGYPETVVALGNRAIDGGILIEPSLSAAVARGVAATWEQGRSSAAYGGAYQAGVLILSGRFAAQPDLARRFLLGYLRGVRVYNDAFVKGEGRAEVVRVLTEQTVVRDPAVYDRMQMAGLDPDGRLARQSLQMELDYFRQRGYYTGALTLDDILDTSFAEYAAQQLGPYR